MVAYYIGYQSRMDTGLLVNPLLSNI